MNKTIIINISGIVFHIEEDAYEVLRSYMNDVKRYFSYTPDSAEIVADIENRFAEMFSEKLSDSKQVIEIDDVNAIIAQMGTIKDFDQQEKEQEYTSYGEYRSDKKLFRDPDDRIIGGVCSGVGHYFNVEPRWIRIFAVILVFIGGTGFILYPILWLVMPLARTRADKMNMKGEPVNLQNFKRNFDDEVEAVRKNFANANTGGYVRSAATGIGNLISTILKFAVKVIGVFIILTCIGMLVGLCGALLAFLGVINTADIDAIPFNIVNPEYQTLLYISAFLTIFIPLLALIFLAIRIIFNRLVLSRNVSFTMLIIWIVAFSTSIYYGSKVGADFSRDASFSQITNIEAKPVYYLKLNDISVNGSSENLNIKIDTIDYKGKIVINDSGDDFDHPVDVDIRIAIAEDGDQPTITRTYRSRGNSYETALKYAQNITYQYFQKDSVLYFDSRSPLKKGNLFRGQEVDVLVKIPKGSKVVISGELDNYMRGLNLWDCKPEGAQWHTASEWLATPDGLKCAVDTAYMHKSEENQQ